MRAIVVHPPRPGAELLDVPAPVATAGEVAVQVLEAGVCGTDRDIVSGKYGRAPAGVDRLILGHENLGRVAGVGSDTAGFRPGDLVVATVRRGCGVCRFCRANRSDFCETGRFTERGISGADGYFADAYVESPDYLVPVPAALRTVAVLLEPLSVVEKALEEGRRVLERRESHGTPPAGPPRALVAGTGAIGMLAAFLLRAGGSEVTAIDRHDADTPAGRILAGIGARHVNAAVGVAALEGQKFDLIVEAGGSATLDFALLPALGPNGALVLTGIPPADTPPFAVPGGALLRELVLENQAIVGSVNANRTYFEAGVRDLARFRALFGDALERVIEERRPLERYPTVLGEREPGGVKSVLTIAN